MPGDPAHYRSRSLWLDDLADDPLEPRPPLPGDVDADVAIVGAGFTGLWTARSLLEIDPHLRVVMLEAEIAGFGASGRNGGWCSALLPMTLDRMARGPGGHAGALAMQRAMFDTVDEVGRAAAADGIDCGFTKGGTLTAARNPAQVARLRAEVDKGRAAGLGPEDLGWLGPDEAQARIRVEGSLGAMYTPHCAAVQPAALARGLARAVERRGGRIHEHTRVLAVEPGRVRTEHGLVRAQVVVRATEAYTAQLPGLRRALVPLYSLMIATEPLPPAVWSEVGWAARETFADGRHLVIYAQRTADDRLAFGGRGAPYHFGSRVDPRFDHDPAVHHQIRSTMVELFPAVADARITHAWGGPLAAPRDWYASVGYDRATGLAWAGGYVGDGVGATNLAGRTLADLITGRATDLTRLPWVGHRSRPWEPEPLRWLGVNAAMTLPVAADRSEAGRRGRVGWESRALARLLGR